VALGVSAAILFLALKSREAYLALPSLPAEDRGVPPGVDVIIPARNEAANIQKVVASFPGRPVLVVDDESTDTTVSLARDAGALVIPAPRRPQGWLGKPHACWTGAQQAGARWLLFVDADTWYEPGFLDSLLAFAEEGQLVAATVFPRQELHTWSEKLLLPYALGLFFTGVNAWAVNHSKSPEALGNGQCLLVRRDAYEFLQGHRAVANSVVEGLALARLMKRHRMEIRVLRAEHLAHVRMYDSFRTLWRGFEKSSFRSLRINPGTGWQVILAAVVMTAWLPTLVWLAVSRHWTPTALFFFIPALAWRAWYGGFLRALSAPVAIYLFQAIAVTAMCKHILGLTTNWKGREV